MPTPRGHNSAKVHTVWYSYKGVWTEPEGKLDPDAERRKRASERKVAVDIYVNKTTDDYNTFAPPYPIKAIEFEMRCESVLVKKPNSEYRHPLSFTGTNIEELRQAMWGALDKNFAVKWEDYLLVEVEHKSGYGSGESYQVEIHWWGVERGKAHDGTLLMRDQTRYGGSEAIKPWPKEFKDYKGRVLALIPDTEENVASLRDFKKRFKMIAVAMQDMLKPDKIQETFAALAGTNLLPFSTTTPKKEE